MLTIRARIVPRTAFGTLPRGDTMFGQLCWAVRNRHGEARLTELLNGYCSGDPFVVVSDALPADCLPRPALPAHRYRFAKNEDRKALKRRRWVPLDSVTAPLQDWLGLALEDGDITTHGARRPFLTAQTQPHNSIDRATGTTGSAGFAPYQAEQFWYAPGARLDVWVVVDDGRLDGADVAGWLADIGETGFGRDASIGLGKFELESVEERALPTQAGANGWVSLAPCAPQGLSWQRDLCFYQPFVRFGRHGDAAVLSGRPFKSPVMLAQTGAVLVPAAFEARLFVGCGLGGDGSLSRTIAGTVHQGYSPVVGVAVPVVEGER